MAYRLGDVVDDYCSRCRMITNNSVEPVMCEEIVKGRCRTCNSSHDYKHGKLPEKVKPKKTSTKSAYDAVLASVLDRKNLENGATGGPPAQQKPSRRRQAALHHGLHALAAIRR